jgi:hypothetical protein
MNIAMDSPDGPSETLTRVVTQHLRAFASVYGFTFHGTQNVSTKAIPEWYESIFCNLGLEKELVVTYIVKGRETREVFELSFRLRNPKFHEFDYTSLNCMTVNGVDIGSVSGILSERLAICIRDRLEVMKANYVDILSSDKFDTEHTDWNGLK